MSHRFIITGTDTGVGKTVVSAWLSLRLGGYYWKPIQCGHDADGRGDTERVASLGGRIAASPAYDFALARSPHEAARAEGREVALSSLSPPPTFGSGGKSKRDDDILIIEGAGGVLVPLNERDMMLDAFSLWQGSVIVVARTILGTINHSCLTLAALRSRGLAIRGVIMVGNGDRSHSEAIALYGGVRILAHLPHLSPLTMATLAGTPLEDEQAFFS